MKIEKLSNDNINDFIEVMELDSTKEFSSLLTKDNYFAVKEEDTYIIGFSMKESIDTIEILFINNKIDSNKFIECIKYLNNSLVVESHLIIEIRDNKYMKIMDEYYKCKDMSMTLKLSNEDSSFNNLKEKIVDIDMKSIRYFASSDVVLCDLSRQNIKDELLINSLHEYFKSLHVKDINFVIYEEVFEYLDKLKYLCYSKSYVIE